MCRRGGIRHRPPIPTRQEDSHDGDTGDFEDHSDRARLGIRRATVDDQQLVGDIVAAAFMDDPTTTWIFPDRVRRSEVLPPMFALYASAYIAHGETYVNADGTSVAMWLPPGAALLAPEQEEAFGQAVQEVAAEGIGRLAQLEETFAPHHPSEPLWYLQFLATVPASQGQGIGSVFLQRDPRARRPRRHAGVPRGDHTAEPRPVRAPRLRDRR